MSCLSIQKVNPRHALDPSQMKRSNCLVWDFVPAAADCSNGFEAAWGELAGACVAAVHSPVEEIDLVGIEFQEQDDDFTAKLMDLKQEKIKHNTDSYKPYFIF